MNRIALILLAAATCTLSAIAQPPGGRGGRGEGRGPGGPDSGPPTSPIVEALDVDKDGVISSSELDNATAALKTLDKNADGQLSDEEVRPPHPDGDRGRPDAGDRPREGSPRGRGAEGRGAEGRGGEGRGAEGRGRGDRGPGGGDQGRRGLGGPGGPPPNGGGNGISPERMLTHAMEFDADQDKMLSLAELKKFIADFAKQHGGDQMRRGGGDRGQRGAGREGGERSDRPRRPE